MKFDLAIFDLDGTLVDSLADIGDAMNRILASYGHPIHSYDSYRFFVGNGIKNLVVQSLPESCRDSETVEECYSKMLADYNQNYINKTRLYSGISQLLDNLTAKNIKLAILSNKADSITQKVYVDLLSGWPFDIVMGASDKFPRKPDPSAALFIARSLEVSSEAVCYIGDSNVDMQTACSAGFTAVGAVWGFRSKAELIDAGAMYTINQPIELLSLFG